MAILRRLDLTLQYLSDSGIDNPKTYAEIQKEGLTGLSNRKARLVIEKLEKDGYVDHKEMENKETGYYATLDGIIFNESGGYAFQLKDIKVKRYRRLILNALIGGGTGLAGLYSLWQMSKALLRTLCQYDCY
jgi:hypothetical protein